MNKGRDYVCPEKELHDYTITVADTEEVLVEICTACGHKIAFNKRNGRIDTKRYGETHLLFFLQPNDPLFRKYYPTWRPPKVQNKYAKKSLDEKKSIWEDTINQLEKENKRQVIAPTNLKSYD